jgi:hypothetical protein
MLLQHKVEKGMVTLAREFSGRQAALAPPQAAGEKTFAGVILVVGM